jgi:hypothetical protein
MDGNAGCALARLTPACRCAAAGIGGSCTAPWPVRSCRCPAVECRVGGGRRTAAPARRGTPGRERSGEGHRARAVVGLDESATSRLISATTASPTPNSRRSAKNTNKDGDCITQNDPQRRPHRASVDHRSPPPSLWSQSHPWSATYAGADHHHNQQPAATVRCIPPWRPPPLGRNAPRCQEFDRHPAVKAV